MHSLPSPSNCILSGIVAAVIAFGITGGPIDFLSGKQLPRPNPQVLVADVSPANYVDRSHKSDRLPMRRADPIASTSIVKKNVDTPDYIVRIALELPRDCEALASSLSDPILGRIAGRCFV